LDKALDNDPAKLATGDDGPVMIAGLPTREQYGHQPRQRGVRAGVEDRQRRIGPVSVTAGSIGIRMGEGGEGVGRAVAVVHCMVNLDGERTAVGRPPWDVGPTSEEGTMGVIAWTVPGAVAGLFPGHRIETTT
jgi:hypothetical protein